jgi:hypothetical protein
LEITLPDWLSTKKDYYPIGSNGLWHGGIHITSGEKWVKPLFPGKVISGKVQHDSFIVKRPGETGDPIEEEYSASYLLLENTQKVRLDKDRNHEKEEVELQFFTLYMHIRPFKHYSNIELTSFELPFYLKWDAIKIQDISISVRKIAVDTYALYDTSTVELDEPGWFYPNFNRGSKNTLKIKIYTGKESNSTVSKEIAKNYLDTSRLDSGTVRIKPKKTAGSIPIYSSVNNTRDKFLGYLSTAEDYFLQYDRGNQPNAAGNVVSVQFSNKGQKVVSNVCEGILLKDIPLNPYGNYSLTEPAILYSLVNNNNCRIAPVDEYLSQYKRQLENEIGKREKQNLIDQYYQAETLAVSTKTVKISGRDYLVFAAYEGFNAGARSGLIANNPTPAASADRGPVIISRDPPESTKIVKLGNQVNESVLPDVFRVIIKNNEYLEAPGIHNCLFNVPGETVRVCTLTKSIYLRNGQGIKRTGDSGLPLCGHKVQVYFFSDKNNDALVDIQKFEAADTTRIQINLSQTAESEAGIPCYDTNGYIRNLLKINDTFEYVNGELGNGNRITIKGISSYSDKRNVRYFLYRTGIKLNGESKIHEEKCERQPVAQNPDVYKIKEHEPVGVSDIIGKPGRFGCDGICHIEVLAKDKSVLTSDVFEKKYQFNFI